MLKISKKADYAIVLLCLLAQDQARATADDPARLRSASELAEATGLSQSLVANLLKDYTRAGFLESVRGAQGGYRLARRADQLGLREILTVIEGPIHFVECAEGVVPGAPTIEVGFVPDSATPSAPNGRDEDQGATFAFEDNSLCSLHSLCPSKGPLQILHNRIVAMLESLTLAELAQFEAQQASLTSPDTHR